jgi:transaldolase/glucose-6-phosphate isomerase
MPTPLHEIEALGQSIWYDNLRRGLITAGELNTMAARDGLLGVTSNPAIFEKAMSGPEYEPAFKALVAEGVGGAKEIYERLAVEDIRLACDVLHPSGARTGGRDGYVSLEVSPYLAHDTAATVEEARRLHKAVRRDNVMIKVPATPAGVPAIRTLISDGISVNVTLLFAVASYEAVVEAYMSGLEARAAAGHDISKIASVASFFVSRIDTVIDDKLTKAAEAPGVDAAKRERLPALRGKAAVANALVAYGRYQELYAGARWAALAAKGAKPQRLLWASTGVKNPAYPPLLYVDTLVGPDTVNTTPPDTLSAILKAPAGHFRRTLGQTAAANFAEADKVLKPLAEAGVSLRDATDFLLADGVQKFTDSFDKLLGAVEKKRQALLPTVGIALSGQSLRLPEPVKKALDAEIESWRAGGKVRRLWASDASLWSNADEPKWTEWLNIVGRQKKELAKFPAFSEEVKAAGFRHVVVLGMGGSSLCPDVLRRTFGKVAGSPELLVLDSTVPSQVRAVERAIDPAKTLFIVSSKSGSTIEPNTFRQYFFDKVAKAVGADKAGQHFVAVTDPGTLMNRIAEGDRYRRIFFGLPAIGGRFSALSDFGMVPAAAMGLDVPAFLASAEEMIRACGPDVPPEANPGVQLGLLMGLLAKRGTDKVTFTASPGIAALGGWLEQLIAESTGKRGVGVVPVDEEPVGPADVYGDDRLFVYLRLATAPDAAQDAAVDALEKAGRPVVRISVASPMALGQEFFRWEIATAVAGAVLGINPFDQPDVEAAKIAARKRTSAYEATGTLPAETPLWTGEGVSLFADGAGAEAIQAAARAKGLVGALAAHLARVKAGDYFAVNAFVDMNAADDKPIQAIRNAVRNGKRVATTVGYGPRFLHSTGQLHKGGANNGVFLHVTAEDAEDLPIPGQKFGFSVLKKSQAAGDFEVLTERGRRVLRVHLGTDVAAGLEKLAEAVRKAL